MQPTPKPWYREPWPWILMAGPAVVVVAGIATAVIAIRTADPMVADYDARFHSGTQAREHAAAPPGARAAAKRTP